MADFVDPFAAPAANAMPAAGAPTTSGFNDPFAPPAPPPVAAPAPSGGFLPALGQIGAGFARGALVDLPKLVGQAAQFAGINNTLGASADARGQQSWLTLNPEQHGPVVNALASGAEQVAPLVGGLAAGAGVAAGAAAALPVELPALATAGITAGAGGLLFAGQAGQQTLDMAQAKGVSPQAAADASRLNYLTTLGTQVGLGMVGGKVLSAAGGAFNKLVGSEAAPLASQVIDGLTGNNPFAGAGKAALTGTAEALGLNAAQTGTTAAINQQYGIDNTNPLDAIKDSIEPTLGMMAVLTPLGLAGKALAARGARTRTSALAAETSPPEVRSALADQYAAALVQDGSPASQQAAKEFRANATVAIDNNQPLQVDASLFTRNAVPGPTDENGQRPIPGGELPVPETPQDNTLPTNVPVERDLLGNPTSPATPETAATPEIDPQSGLPFNAPADLFGNTPEQPQAQPGLFTDDASADATQTPGDATLQGNDLFAAADAADAAAARRLPVPVGTPEAAPRSIVVDSQGNAATPEQVAARAAERISLGNDLGQAGRQAPPETDPVAAAAADLANNTRDPLATKSTADIRSDITDVNTTLGTKDIPQTVQPVQKILDSLKIDTLPDHQAQIDALDAKLADPDAKIGNATRDRLQALSDKWKSDLGQTTDEATPETQPEAATSAPEAVPEAAPAAAPEAAAETPKSAVTAEPIELPKAQQDAVNERTAMAGEAPADIKALGSNIPEGSPETRGQPPAAAAVTDTLTPNTGATLAARVDNATTGLVQRQAGGEKLSDLDTERLQDLRSFKTTLAQVAKNPGRYSEDYVNDIMSMAEKAAAGPYKKSYRDKYTAGTPETATPGIVAPFSSRLNATLQNIAANGSSPEVKAYAQRLRGLDLDTTIQVAPQSATDATRGVEGRYLPGPLDHIRIFNETEATVLHEATHAATEAAISRAESLQRPTNQNDARLKSAYSTIEQIRQGILARLPGADQYGLNDAHEFVAELYSNKGFQDFLKSNEVNGQSLWQRVVGAVRSMLGLKPSDTFLEKAMAASDTFFQKPDETNAGGFPLPVRSSLEKLFNKSPKDAAAVTDEQYTKTVGLLNKALPDLNFKNINRAVFQKALGWQTVQYIAGRTGSVPDFVKSGLSAAVDKFYATHTTHRMATEAIEHPITKFAQNVQQIMTKLGDANKARDLSQLMATISGEASRGQFDYRMNYSDNVKAGRTLPPENKAYVDNIHRQFTQLRSTNPEAAKAIENGELLNKKVLTTITSSLSTNLMDAAAGVARRLQGELNTLRPDDARRAELQNQVNAANSEAALYTQHSAGLDFMSKDVLNAKHTDHANFSDGSSQVLDSRLNALFAAANTLPAGSSLRASLGELSNMYHAQAAHPYFSLGRDGDYFVKVGFKDGIDQATADRLQGALKGSNKVLGNLVGGEDHAFFRVKTADEAQGLYNKLIQAGGDKIDGTASAKGLLADKDYMSATGVTAAMRQMIDSLHGAVAESGVSDEAAAAIRQTLTRQVLSMLPETSSRSAKMNRQGVPGYDADFLGNYSRRATGGVRDTANIYTQRQFSSSLKGMSDAVSQMARTSSIDSQARGQMIANEINTRYANGQKSMDNSVVNTINSLGHTFFLAASPAYIIRTMAQPFHRAVPLLGSRYGFVNSSTEIGRATGTAIKIAARTIKEGYATGGARGVLDANTNFRGMGLAPKEEAFIQELHDRGILNLGQSRQLQSMSLGGTQRQQDITRMAGMTAQYAEMTNRLSTALAAFRLAEKGRPGVDQAGTERNTEYAIDVTKKAMDDFEQSNTARQIGKHGIIGSHTPLVTAFMNYNLQTMQQIARTVHDGLFNQDPSPAGLQRAKEARREFAGLMATTFMISGALGLPFANAAAGVYNTLTNDNDDPKDIRMSAQKYLENTFGGTVGGVISHGIPHALGMDSSTFGLENLLPGSDFLASRQLLKDRMSDQSQATLGPALNGIIGIAQAADKFSDGYYVKGIEAALPSGLKPYFKAAELAERGYTDSKGNPIGIDATPWDVGLQAVGFNSAKRLTQEENSEFNAARTARQEFRKQQISDEFFKAVSSGAPLDGSVNALTTYNIKNPTQPIEDVEEGITRKYTGLALARASGTGVSMTERQYPSLAQQLLQTGDTNAAMP